MTRKKNTCQPIAQIFQEMIYEWLKIEQNYINLGVERTSSDVRKLSGDCLTTLIEAIRKATNLTGTGRFGTNLPANGTFCASLPAPLYVLINELHEIDQNRPSLLLSHKKSSGKNTGVHHNLLQVSTRAVAAATVQVLIENECSSTVFAPYNCATKMA